MGCAPFLVRCPAEMLVPINAGFAASPSVPRAPGAAERSMKALLMTSSVSLGAAEGHCQLLQRLGN